MNNTHRNIKLYGEKTKIHLINVEFSFCTHSVLLGLYEVCMKSVRLCVWILGFFFSCLICFYCIGFMRLYCIRSRAEFPFPPYPMK